MRVGPSGIYYGRGYTDNFDLCESQGHAIVQQLLPDLNCAWNPLIQVVPARLAYISLIIAIYDHGLGNVVLIGDHPSFFQIGQISKRRSGSYLGFRSKMRKPLIGDLFNFKCNAGRSSTFQGSNQAVICIDRMQLIASAILLVSG